MSFNGSASLTGTWFELDAELDVSCSSFFLVAWPPPLTFAASRGADGKLVLLLPKKSKSSVLVKEDRRRILDSLPTNEGPPFRGGRAHVSSLLRSLSVVPRMLSPTRDSFSRDQAMDVSEEATTCVASRSIIFRFQRCMVKKMLKSSEVLVYCPPCSLDKGGKDRLVVWGGGAPRWQRGSSSARELHNRTRAK